MLYAIRSLREIGLKSPSVPEPKCEDPLPILESENIYLNQFIELNELVVSLSTNCYILIKFSATARYAVFN